MTQSNSSAANMASPISRTPTSWSDMSQHWNWPKLLKAIPMALGPGRLVLAFFVVIAFAGLDKLYVAIFGIKTGVTEGPFSTLVKFIADSIAVVLNGASVRGLDSTSVSNQLYELFIGGPWTFLSSANTWWLVFITPVFLAVMSMLAGALSRSAACEFAADVRISMGKSFRFAMKNFWSLFFAFAAPLFIVWLIALTMTGLGWLMYHASVPAFFFSIFYFVYLLMSLVLTVILIAYFVSAIMLAPAIACEGTDAYDAIQRAYAYVFSKPFKLVLYVFVIIWAGLIAVSLVATVALFVNRVAIGTSQITAHTEVYQVPAQGAAAPANPPAPVALTDSPTASRAMELVRQSTNDTNRVSWFRRASLWNGTIWESVIDSFVIAFVLSYIFCAGTILYLLMRKLADGQELEEIWMPGMVPGTAAAASPSPVTGGSPTPPAPGTPS